MSGVFVEAVIDTLVPGDDGGPPLPSGSAAGVAAALVGELATHLAVTDAIARAAGGEEDFIRSDAATRAAAVREVERAMPDAFAALLVAVVEEYYDSDAVILALGWTAGPPQPSGHPLAAFDEGLLGSVKRRGPLWRDARTGRTAPPGAQTEAPQRRGRAPGPARGVPPSEGRT